jgi:hypothetical protein
VALGQGGRAALGAEQSSQPRIAEHGAEVDGQRRSRVGAAADRDRGPDLLDQTGCGVAEDCAGEVVDRCEALVEVALGQAGLRADVGDRRRGDAFGAEELEAGVEQASRRSDRRSSALTPP